MGMFCGAAKKPLRKGQHVDKVGRTWLYRLRDQGMDTTLRRLDNRALLNEARGAQRPQVLLRKAKVTK